MEKLYTVKELAELSRVSIRTLHYYDEIKLLSPKSRSQAGYRLYGEKELLKLQQILFYRELEIPLKDIKLIIEKPDFSELTALHEHRQALAQRQETLTQLINTIDLTIHRLEGKAMVSNKDLYKGFTTEQVERYEKEVREKYDAKIVSESQNNLKKMTTERWEQVQREGNSISIELAKAMQNGQDPCSPSVQKLVRKHHQWIENFYLCSKEVYLGLGKMYVEHPDFCAHYDQYGEGLATFLNSAMREYAKSL